MTIEIKITGENAVDVLAQLKQFGSLPVGTQITVPVAVLPASVEVRTEDEVKEIRKEKKTKTEKVAEPKAEVLALEKPKYTLQDAIDASRKYVGTPEDVAFHEPHLRKLQTLNTSLGVKLVRELPAEKLDGFMAELTKLVEASATPTTNLF